MKNVRQDKHNRSIYIWSPCQKNDQVIGTNQKDDKFQALKFSTCVSHLKAWKKLEA